MKIPLLWTAPFLRIIYELWCRSLRYRQKHRSRLDDLVSDGEPVCLALWHNELFPLMHVRAAGRFGAIVSRSGDGELLARVLESMGIATARGSSSRGGVQALVRAARLMRKEGRVICVTVDGPRGPRHEVKEGVIHLARMSRGKIVPVRLFMHKYKRFASWDRFQLPLPFSLVEVNFGHPFQPWKEKGEGEDICDEREEIRRAALELKAKLEEITPEV
ncbi:MAG: lysophospholipid acyltransferase family protein [Desulfovibrionaceae bacterium]|nr:lysophospholipid acyltransferase family protein [Desulfovibrionaceae bacterium]